MMFAVSDWSRAVGLSGAERVLRRLSPVRSTGSIVDDAVEDRVGERRDADHVVPAIDGNWLVMMSDPLS